METFLPGFRKSQIILTAARLFELIFGNRFN